MPSTLSKPINSFTGIPRLIVFSLVALLPALIIAGLFNPLPLEPTDERRPAPYRIPKIKGGLPLRMAMVHDVLHQRYLHHGEAWYTQRIADSRRIIDAELSKPHQPTPARLDAMDDLAVALDNLHRDDEAIAVMRDKLTLLNAPPLSASPTTAPDKNDAQEEIEKLNNLEPLSPEKHHEYTAHANLGTALIHSNFPGALQGNAAARKMLEEGLAHIDRAIEINPAAHFGRENWQAIVVRHFLACIDHPELFVTYTMIGDPVAGIPRSSRSFSPYRIHFGSDPDTLSADKRHYLRAEITTVGIDDAWAKLVHPAYPNPMPFDEPTLALMGMWMLGGGPNPHSAMALGRIMENVGQRSIAWNAYQRALDLQDRFSPVPELKAALVTACRNRQNEIAHSESPKNPAGWQADMLRTHAAELAFGEKTQKEYQDFEAAQIKASIPLTAPHFYDAFLQSYPNIASPPGTVDDFIITHIKPQSPLDYLPISLLAVSLGTLCATFRRKKKPSPPLVTT